MGNIATGLSHRLHPDEVPGPNKPLQFDPLIGFPNGRKEKVMVATEEEMRSAKIPLDKRDYCAHKLLEFLACRNKNYPWVVKCHHEKHHYLECEYQEFLDRTKDYEREKRLMKREKRIKARAEG
ncbi:NADH dehydrogenase [ubiquinone] 1 beta subcomplex subunit 7 [Halyomorpha halys]|uniref:NADH dehydrogenase [ubiquinone] 1 beta subcomplex subunit 7 n=1 Tax=Halyomorpha halys TaxID=286706 RepID=UPI0006D4CFB4|nr:NADH dehydrogenase [ubiquinone] 1 beta subcomplex subunit 7 [Halyomorpha halys]